ncbi:MAG: putative porin [Candidatus Omnitrophica bacterium]|nr:putative porin [Candidatus Omnitrophota bacterium]
MTSEEAQDVRNDMAKDSGPASKMREEDTKDTVKKMAGGSWLDKVKWGGDFRLRHETQFRDTSSSGALTPNRNRERMRLRFGFVANPWDPLQVGVQLGTGTSGDPISNNQTFTNTSDKKAIFIDKAYAKYTPQPWVSAIGGKMDNPFLYTDMVWDPDTTPEGLAVQLKSPKSVPILNQWLPVRPFVTMGAFALGEINSAKLGHPMLWGAQGGTDIDLPVGGVTFQPSVAYYDYGSIKGNTVASVTSASAGAAGNSTSGGKWIFDYNIIDVLGKLMVPDVLGQPVTFVGDAAWNVATNAKNAVDGSVDNGGAWSAGVEVGKVTEKLGSWKATYYFKHLEQNAVFGPLTDSDFGGGGTNHVGHVIGLQFGLNKWTSLAFKYFRVDEIIGSQNRNNTFQADLNVKF